MYVHQCRFEEWKLEKMYPARSLETSISDLEKGRKGTNFEDEIEKLWEKQIGKNYKIIQSDHISSWVAKEDSGYK